MNLEGRSRDVVGEVGWERVGRFGQNMCMKFSNNIKEYFLSLGHAYICLVHSALYLVSNG